MESHDQTTPHFYFAISCLILLFIVVMAGTLWHLQKFLQCIKYLNSPLLPFSFITLYPFSWNSCDRYNFSLCVLHVYGVFAPYSPSYTLFPPPPPLTGTRPHRQNLFHSLVLWFPIRKNDKKNDVFACLDSYTGSFLVALPCIYVL
jgi:hypothetical protein